MCATVSTAGRVAAPVPRFMSVKGRNAHGLETPGPPAPGSGPLPCRIGRTVLEIGLAGERLVQTGNIQRNKRNEH